MDTDHEQIPTNYKLYLTPLREMESQELWDAAKNVESLLAHPGWEFVQGLVDRVERRMTDALVRDVGRGKQELSDYTAHAGLVRGLRVAKDAAETVLLISRERDEEEKRMAESGRELEEQHG